MSFRDTQNPGIGGLDELTLAEEQAVQTIAALGTPGYFLRTNLAGTGLEWAASSNTKLFVTVGDSSTDFPVANYADIGDAVNAAYASLPSTGGTVFMQNGTYSFTTPIVFGTNGKIASLLGSSAGGTILYFTPTSGNAITVNHGDTAGRHRQHEVGHFSMRNAASFVYVGTANTRTTRGLFLGGSNGCPGIHVHDMTINGFGTQIEIGQACYMASWTNLSLSGGNGVNGTGTGLQGSLVHINTASNSGEKFAFTHCTFTDPCNSEADNAVYVESSGSASLFFTHCSFDNVQLRVIGSTHTVVDQCHFENPTAASYGEYIPVYLDAFGSGTFVFTNNEIVENATSSSNNFTRVIYHGINLIASGNHIFNYSGQTMTTIFDNGLSSGNASAHVTGTVVEGGDTPEIINGVTYTKAIGMGTVMSYQGSAPAIINTSTLNLGTSSVATLGTLEIGNASDTTLSRSSAGVLAVEGVVIPTISSANTLTNKTIALGSNTVSGTKAEFNTAVTDGNFLFVGDADVVGPASSTDNAVARFDSTTGKLLQNSAMTVDDNGAFVAADGSKVSGNDGGGFGYIIQAIENTNSGGRVELSLDTDDGAFAGFLAMAGSATTNKARQLDLGTRVAGATAFWTNDTERMTILSGGNVGIGEVNPATKLEVFSSGEVIRVGNDTNADAYLGFQNTGSAFRGAVGYQAGSGYMVLQGGSSKGIWLNVNNTTFGSGTAVAVLSTGEVGIATTSPSAFLDVNSNTIRLRTARTPASATAAGNAGDICWDANYIYVCTATNTWKRVAIATW